MLIRNFFIVNKKRLIIAYAPSTQISYNQDKSLPLIANIYTIRYNTCLNLATVSINFNKICSSNESIKNKQRRLPL